MQPYRRHRTLLIPALLLLGDIAHAGEIYHWVDEDGIAHYSQTPPADTDVQVEARELATTTPDDYDPDDYEYSVMNQAERIHSEWAALLEERAEERAAEREARREERDYPARQAWRDERRGWRYGSEFYYPGVLPRHPRHGSGRKTRRYQFEQLDELGLWREPPAYSINSTRHWQRVRQTRELTRP